MATRQLGELATHMEVWLRYVCAGGEVERLRALGLEQDARAVAYAWAACLGVDLAGALAAIQIPSLVIAGLQDFFTPPYVARAVAAGLPQVELEVWEETGHFPFLEDPVRFNRRLEAFVLRCLAQKGIR